MRKVLLTLALASACLALSSCDDPEGAKKAAEDMGFTCADEMKFVQATTTFRGRDTASLDRLTPQREGKVENYPRLSLHVWNLVGRALRSMGYGIGS